MLRRLRTGVLLVGLCCVSCVHTERVVLLSHGGTLEVEPTGQQAVRLAVAFEGLGLRTGTFPTRADVSLVELKDTYGDHALTATWEEPYSLYFTEATTLAPFSEAVLRELLPVSRQANVREILLVGYTDSLGTPEQNKELALCRARTIARALTAAGVTIPIVVRGVWTTGQDTPHFDAEKRRADVRLVLY